MLKILFLVLQAFLTSVCIADEACESLAKRVIAVRGGEHEDNWWLSNCKTYPDNPAQTIMALGNEVLLIDTQSGRILSQGDLGKTIVSSGRAIDTGRYWLTPKIRAFGIRFSQYRQHFNAGENIQTLNLYVIQGKRILPVLELLGIGWDGGGTECDENGNHCLETKGEERLVIKVAKTRHNGYADLIVNGEQKSCDDRTSGNGCCNFEMAKFNETGLHDVLKFDRSRYVVPASLLQEQ